MMTGVKRRYCLTFGNETTPSFPSWAKRGCTRPTKAWMISDLEDLEHRTKGESPYL